MKKTTRNVVKVLIVGPKTEAPKVLSLLSSSNILHPEKLDTLGKTLEISEMEDLVNRIVKLRSAKNLFEPFFRGKIGKEKILPLTLLKKKIDKLNIQIEKNIKLFEEKKELENKFEGLKQDLTILSGLDKDVDLGVFQSEQIFMSSGKLPTDKFIELRNVLNTKLSKHLLVKGKETEGWTYAIVGVLQKDKENLNKILKEHTWSQIFLPPIPGKISEVIDSAKVEITRINKKQKEIKSRIRDNIKVLYPKIVFFLEMIENYHRVMGLSRYAKQTEYTFLLGGWVAKKSFNRLKALLALAPGTEIELQKFNSEDAPVLVEQPRGLKPFYSIISLRGAPKLESPNPLFSLIFTFPLFFGMMLSDIGYGTLLFFLSLIFRKKVNNFFKFLLGKPFENFSDVLLISGLVSAIFGFLFGEIFGFNITPLLFNRLENAKRLLFYTALVGVAHLNFGLILKSIADIRRRLFEPLMTNLSWFLLQSSIIFFIIHSAFAWFVLIVSLISLWSFGKTISIIEVPLFFGDVISYVRLAAIGLASSGIAMVINLLAKIAGPYFGWLVLIVGHSLNFMLGILSPFIQATRLHLVEFFSKFYEPAGREFSSFSIKSEHTGGEMVW